MMMMKMKKKKRRQTGEIYIGLLASRKLTQAVRFLTYTQVAQFESQLEH
jgi:hypothetical protein